MSGRGTISVNQSPQYGDKSALASASKAYTKTPMTGVTVPAPAAGRPVSSNTAVSQTGNIPVSGNIQQQQQVDPDTQAALNDLAQAFRTHQFWQNVLQQYPSEWSKMYARDAQKNYEQIKQKTRNATPFFAV